jgi:hypothetical protein
MSNFSPEEIIKRLDKLKSERNNYETFWQDVAKYVIPRKAYITRTRTPGGKYDYDVYDSTAMMANIILAAGLHSYLTNPNSRWFSLRVQDEVANKDEDVKLWLSDTENRIYNTLNASNFNEQIHELYLDLGTFGVACMYEEEDAENGVRFYTRDIAEIYLCENEREKVDTVYRKFTLSARQAFDKWSEKAGEVVKVFMDKKEYDKLVTFIHCVTPRYVRDVSKVDAGNMPFESTYIEVSKKHLISESGYQEFPYFTPRFNKNSGEVWGSSPGMVSYSDIKMLNEMVKVLIRAAQKIVDPPIVLPHDGFILPIKYGPAALNFRTKTSANDKIELLSPGGDIPVGMEIINEYRNLIKKNYFVDLFLLLADPARKDMTATEVMQRVEEKMLILAPVLGRLMNEFLDPLINRTFAILWRTNKIVPPPDLLKGLPYKIEYISPLARSQKLDQMKSINSFLALIGQMATVKPDVLDNVNEDEIVKNIQDLYGVNPKFVRGEDEVKAIRQARTQQIQQQQQLAQLQQGADIIETGSNIDKNLKPEAK